VDLSHPQAEEQIAAVNTVLAEIGAENKPTLMVFNKIDRLHSSRELLPRFLERHPNAVGISAMSGVGITELLAELGVQLRPVRELVELKIPHEESAVIARLHKLGQVIESRYLSKVGKFTARIPPHHHAEFAEFIVGES
jgi:GTP-binding protein HflX